MILCYTKALLRGAETSGAWCLELAYSTLHANDFQDSLLPRSLTAKCYTAGGRPKSGKPPIHPYGILAKTF